MAWFLQNPASEALTKHQRGAAPALPILLGQRLLVFCPSMVLSPTPILQLQLLLLPI